MRRLIGLAGVAMILLAACGGTDRPEGAVENWLIALNQGHAWGWTSPLVIGCLALGVALLVAFARLELRTARSSSSRKRDR